MFQIRFSQNCYSLRLRLPCTLGGRLPFAPLARLSNASGPAAPECAVPPLAAPPLETIAPSSLCAPRAFIFCCSSAMGLGIGGDLPFAAGAVGGCATAADAVAGTITSICAASAATPLSSDLLPPHPIFLRRCMTRCPVCAAGDSRTADVCLYYPGSACDTQSSNRHSHQVRHSGAHAGVGLCATTRRRGIPTRSGVKEGALTF